MESRLRPRVNGRAVVESKLQAAALSSNVTEESIQINPVGSKTTTTKAQAKPKPKTQVKRQTCVVCAESLIMARFASNLTSSNCEHEVEACRNCTRIWITSQLEENGPEEIECITCGMPMDDQALQAHVEPATFKQIVKQLAYLHNSRNPEYHFCQAPSCEEGQIHQDVTQPFTCNTCSEVSCVNCGGSWHEDRTCEQNMADGTDNRTEKTLQALGVKICPGKTCGTRIEKVNGCDSMYCFKCRTSFCWACLGIGSDYHEKDCRHYDSPPSREDLAAEAARHMAQLTGRGIQVARRY